MQTWYVTMDEEENVQNLALTREIEEGIWWNVKGANEGNEKPVNGEVTAPKSGAKAKIKNYVKYKMEPKLKVWVM